MRISVDGRRIRNNKVAFSNLSGIVWMRPEIQNCDDCFLWNIDILFDKTIVTILSTLMILLPLS